MSFTINQWNHGCKIMIEKCIQHSTYNEGKSVVAKGFIKTLKNKIYKYMTSILKNVYIDKLGDIIDAKWSPLMRIQAHILTLM